MKTQYNCKQCDYKTISINHLKCHVNAVHLKLRPFKCEKCPSEFSQKSSLRKHFRNYHGENAGKIHQCKECHKVLSTPDKVRRHHREVHEMKDKKVECDMCDYKCTQKGYLKKHKEVVHFKTKKAKCEICYKEFTQKYQLQRHMKVMHTDIEDTDKPFACDQCHFRTMYKRNLKQHKGKVHEETI